MLTGADELALNELRLPFVYGDGDAHIAEAVPMMRGFPPARRLSLGHHANIAQAVARLLDASSPGHHTYRVEERAAGA